jgi:predicted ATPase
VDALSRYLGRLPSLEAEAILPRDVRPLTRLFPVLRRVDAIAATPHHSAETPDQQELRRRAFAALRELLARLGDRRRVVLAIDDLQWGDADSASLLGELLRPPDAPLLLAIGGFRSEDAASNPFLSGLFQWREKAVTSLDWREVPVEPLTTEQARELARRLLSQRGEVEDEQVETIARESLGSPFFVQELAQATNADGAGGVAASATLTLDQVLISRIVRLPKETRRFLEILALAGRPIHQHDVGRAAAVGPHEHAIVADLRTRRLIRRTSRAEQGEIETYHDRIRETVAGHLDPDGARERQRQLAVSLESSGESDPDFLAEQFEKAGCEPEAAHYYTLAASQADDALAFQRAVSFYRKALEYHSGSEEARGELRARLAGALVNAGRGNEAAEEYLLATVGAPPDKAFERQRCAAMQFLVSGNIDRGWDVLRNVLILQR